ncbi:MAG: amino acid adenylation domain-containing protein [Saprospiraceae bacterium]
MFNHYQKILTTIVEQKNIIVGELELLLPEERALILGEVATEEGTWFNEGAKDLANDTPINLRFEKVARENPAAVAVIQGTTTWTYQMLNEYANQVGRTLQNLGVQPGDFVGVYLDRSPQLVACLLGIIKSGAAYVPLDTQNPAERIEQMVVTSALKVMITDAAHWAGLTLSIKPAILLLDEQKEVDATFVIEDQITIQAQAKSNLPNLNRMDSWAYMLYTSGSTGTPKGAITRHDGALNHLLAEYEALDLADGFRFLQSAGIGSDISLWQMLAPLLKGGAMVIVNKYELLDYNSLLEILQRDRIDIIEFVPSYIWGMVEHLKRLAIKPDLSDLKWIMMVGEAVPVPLVNTWKSLYPTVRILNGYGPCEASDDIAQYEITTTLKEAAARVPIGRPIANMNIVVLDAQDKLCPIGIPGELCVSGVGVGAGYWKMPEKTAASFITNPFEQTLGDVLYKTGDLAKWRADGNLEFLGRIDRQVKIRGHRVELGEIESFIRKVAGVKEAHILVYQGVENKNQASVLAFVVATPNTKVLALEQALQASCQQKLPTYMQPQTYVFLEEIPLNLSDKVDEKALVDIFLAGAKNTKQERIIKPCTTTTEQAVLKIWQNILSREDISSEDDFFLLGGHSLLAMRVKAAIQERLSVEIKIRELFIHKTISALASIIDEKEQGSQLPALLPQERTTQIPLSFAQERLWFVDQLEGSTHYHMPMVLRFKGALDKKILEQAFKAMIERHEILRTIFREENGVAYQTFIDANDWALKNDRLATDLSKEAIEAQVFIAINQKFDLSQDYPIRATLFECSKEEHLLVLVQHHIVSDGWSEAIFIEELIEYYLAFQEQRLPKLADLSIQYADYAIWQRNYLTEEVLTDKLNYWKGQLAGIEPLEMPLDFPRPALQSMRGATFQFALNPVLKNQLSDLAQREGVTNFMLLLSAFKVLLYRYSGQTDLCVGSPVADRSQEVLESALGCFVNTLAFRSDLSGNPSFLDVLHQVKTMTLTAYQHRDVPLEKIVDAMSLNRDRSRMPLFQTLFILQNNPGVAESDLGDLALTEETFVVETAKLDLTFSIAETEDTLDLGVEYCTDLFLPETIQQLVVHFEKLLFGITANPKEQISKLEMLSSTEEEKLRTTFARSSSCLTPEADNLVALFEAQVARTPNKGALALHEEELTYQALNERANQLAHHLRLKGVTKETLVGVCIGRSLDMVVAVLGILKAGGAYLPIDPNYPAERIHYLLDDSNVQIVLSNTESAKALQEKEAIDLILLDVEASQIQKAPKTAVIHQIQPEDLAYVIYTSGSTGKPKGVMIEQRNAINIVLDHTQRFEITPEDHVLQFTSLSFDVSMSEIFMAFLGGARLVLVDKATIADTNLFINYLKNQRVNVACIPPGYLSVLDLDKINHLRVIVMGGEVGSVEQSVYCAQFSNVFNVYGPTECSVTTTAYQVRPTDAGKLQLPIGSPLPNTEVYILDAYQQLVPEKVAGEICIGGVGVGRGYLYQEELSKEKFIPNPFRLGERLYRTGDKGKWLPDGNIAFLGRLDNQVKIRGHRIELGEIETILANLDFINQCVVLALPDANKNLQLVAYYVPLAGTTAAQTATIKPHLHRRLPEYMQPTALIEMEAFSMTINDKVDKKALPAPDFTTLVQTAYVAPRNETEVHLAKIWQALLKIQKVGIHDNFFELGGHSLLATRVVSAVRKEMTVEISIKDLFTYPNIAQLSDLMLTERFSTTLPAIVAMERPDRLPLSFAQERLWFIDKLEGSTHYHMPIIQRLSGNFEVGALEYAFQEVINRHEVLRTVFVEENGEAFQQILPKNEWHLSYEEQLDLEAGALSIYLEKLVDKTINQAFDLAKDHMIRARLVKLPKEEYLLIVVLHHIASDGWSNPILFNELVELYEAKQADRSAQLNPLSIQYADYALWQRAYLDGEVLEQKLNYWADKLSGLEVLNLPTDFPRPAIQSNKGGQLIFELDGHLYEGLNNLAQREGSTMFMLLLTVFKVLLHKHSGQNDIVVGTSIANRTQEEIEALIGFFVNTLTLRSDLSGNPSFVDLLAQIRTTTLEAYQHQDVPFEKIVDRVGVQRDMSRSPLFQVLFSYGSNVEVSTVNFSSATTKEPVEETELTEETFAYESTQFDLSFNVVEVSQKLSVAIEYCVDLFKPATIEKLMVHYQSLLSAILKNPKETIGEYQILSEADYTQQVQTFNDTEVAYPTEGTLLNLWKAQVRQSSSGIALKFEDRTMTYQALDEQSTRLAIHLNEHYDLQADDVVGVMMGRSDWAVIAILAILKTGAAYVPIDLDYPMERKAFIIEDTNLKGLIIHSDHLFDVIEFQVPIFSIDIQLNDLESTTEEGLAKLEESSAKPQDLAYLIYTSGSTGKPKGVMIEHRSLLNYLHYGFDRYRTTDTAFSFPLFTSLSFDLTQTSIFLSLMTGGTLCIEAGKEIDEVLQRIVTNKDINTIKLTPAQASILPILRNEHLKVAILGGDQLEKNQVEILRQINPEMRIFNEYGPTEATIGCTVHEVKSLQAAILIGKPISNTEVYILDAQQQLMPLGAAGELCVGGAGLARAYLNRPALSQEKFIKHPFQKDGTARIYRTGDLAKWLPSGDLVYLGRIDDQVKIRGYRIELGEIENVLDACALVKESIALPNTDVNGDKRLIAYIIPTEEFDQASILDDLKKSLPAYMIPSLLIPLNRFPLTSNGKVDKKQLPDPDDSKQVTTVYTAPRNELEEKLVQIWQELLNVEKVGVYDNFFELGGHSLLGIRVVSAIRNVLQIEISIKDLFTHPNIDLLSNFMEQEGKRAALPPIIPEERPAQIPLSFSQERLWFIDKLSGSTHYHIPSVLRLSGTLDIPKLKLSFQRIVNRHEVLRTVLRENEGQPHQVVLPINQWEMSYETVPAATTDKGLEQLIGQAINQAFDLANDHMLRVKLLKVKEEEYVLIFVLHHIASDGWSTPIFIRELMAFYSAQLENSVALLEDLPIQYADYAIWQRAYLQGDLLEEKLTYWTNKLRGAETLSLPIDLPRPSVQSTNGAEYYTQLDASLAEKLQVIAQREGVTMFMLLLTVYKVMLHKYSDQYDISVGSPIANREASEVENLIGFFVNTLVLRSDLSGNPSFRELLQRVKLTTLEAYDAQDVPFEKIVDRLVLTRDKSRSPLFQTMFIWQQKNSAETEEEDLTIGDLTLSAASMEQDVAKFDLSFNLNAREDGVDLSVEYCTDLFLPATIEQMVTHYQILLEQIVENIENELSELQLLDAAATKEVVFDFNQTTVAYPAEKTAVDLFMEQVALRGEAIAIQWGKQQINYQELNERSNQLAHYLQKKNVKEESLVALCMDRSIDLMIAILAVLKAGGAYLPIDPTYPQQRIDYLIQDAKVKVVISDESYFSYFSEHNSLEVLSLNRERTTIAKEAISLPTTQLTPQSLMYVIYTSGSTGRPKGVMIEHTSNVNMALDQIKRFEITPQDNIVQFASIAFDASVYEIFMAFYAGASLVLVDQETIKSGEQFVDYLEQQAVTVATLPPAYLSVLDQSRLSFLRVMITAGESAKVMEAAHCASFSDYYNAYGPTECAVCVSTYKVSAADIHKTQIPIGKALSNTALYVLDPALKAVPINVEGEICVSGAGLARGYLYQEALTAEKFVAHPYLEGERLYRTGDRGKWLPDGNLIFLGRKDDQVKIRGHRIELEEIEMVLEQSALVLQAAVLCRTATNGDKTLVAYLGTSPSGSEMEAEDCQRAITEYLENYLPNYMVPAALVCLDNLPLTTNGKIDKKALLEMEATTWNRTPYVASRNEMERQLVEIWQALLQVERVGVNDNFFEIGGHSLLAIRLMAQIDKRMGVAFPVSILFEAPTIATLAKQVVAQEENKDEARVVKLKAGKGERAIFCVPGVEGDVMSFHELAKQVDEEQSLYAFQAQGLAGKQKPLPTVEAIAAAYIQAMQEVQPEGPYILGGYSFGAKVAYEMAVQLSQANQKVGLLSIFDAPAPHIQEKLELPSTSEEWMVGTASVLAELYGQQTLELPVELFENKAEADQLELMQEKLQALGIEFSLAQLSGFKAVFQQNALTKYTPKKQALDIPIVLFETARMAEKTKGIIFKKNNQAQWQNLSTQEVQAYTISGNHWTILKAPHATEVAKYLQLCWNKELYAMKY